MSRGTAVLVRLWRSVSGGGVPVLVVITLATPCRIDKQLVPVNGTPLSVCSSRCARQPSSAGDDTACPGSAPAVAQAAGTARSADQRFWPSEIARRHQRWPETVIFRTLVIVRPALCAASSSRPPCRPRTIANATVGLRGTRAETTGPETRRTANCRATPTWVSGVFADDWR
jgi:hypothetical protein